MIEADVGETACLWGNRTSQRSVVQQIILATVKTKKGKNINQDVFPFYILKFLLSNNYYPKNEIKTPAAAAEPITPEILLAIQY